MAIAGAPGTLDELFDRAVDFVATAGPDGRFTYLNHAAAELIGYSREELVGEPIARIVAPEHVVTVAEQVRRKASGQRASSVYEIDFVTREGKRIPVEISSSSLVVDGEHRGQLAIARDLRERRALEEQLRQAQKLDAMGRLAGGIAHDFNNVLLVIRGYGELMLGKLEADHPTRGYAEKIAAEAERATTLTRSLLAFARAEPVNPQPVDLDALLEELAGTLRVLIGSSIEVELERSGEAFTVRADRAALEQILFNLAGNARDAMPGGGRLTLATRPVTVSAFEAESLALEPGRYQKLTVSDTGTGMDAEARERAFEPFFTTKERGEGTGLGLSMAYGLIRGLGGHITVDSAPGEGTTFSLYFVEA